MAIGTNDDDLFMGTDGPDEYLALDVWARSSAWAATTSPISATVRLPRTPRVQSLAYGGEGDDIIPIDGGAGDDSLFGGTNLSNEGSEFDGIAGGEGDDLILRGDEPTTSATTRVANVALEAFLIEP